MFVSALSDRQSFSMQVREAGSTSDTDWRTVWGKEAAAVNPLAAVNHGRNTLIQNAMKTNDWSGYHQFQAKQHPAWYDQVNGSYEPNKVYYANLIDTQYKTLQEAKGTQDSVEIAKRTARLEESIADFKKAPGQTPHVAAFSADPELAKSHGIQKPDSAWYDSPYNNHLAASQGRFQDDYWYENPYFIDHPRELKFAIEAVQENRPEIAEQIPQEAVKKAFAAADSPVQSIVPSAVLQIAAEVEKELFSRENAKQIPSSEERSPLFQFHGNTAVESAQQVLLEQLGRKTNVQKYV